MTQKAQQEELADLKNQVTNLRSFVIGIAGRDSEGEYNPIFVQSILEASKEESGGEFSDANSFLSLLE